MKGKKHMMKLKVIRTGSHGNSLLLGNEDEGYVLIDCGAKFLEIKESIDYDLSKIIFALSLHSHSDHSRSRKDIINAGILLLDYESTIVTMQGQATYKDWTMKFWPIEHDVPNYAMLLKHNPTGIKYSYISDTSYSPLTPICHNLIIEISYCDEVLEQKKGELNDRYLRLKKYHMSLARAKELISEMTKVEQPILKNIIVTHMSKLNSDGDQIKRELFELTGIMPILAEDGKEYEL